MNKYDKAIQTLDNMRNIVKNNMLTRSEYITRNVVNRKLAEQGAVCRGHKACAIGSLWLAHGIKIVPNWDGRASLPGVYDPSAYARRYHPGLKLALDALNAQASKFIEANKKEFDRRARRRDAQFDEPIEQLFEGAYGTKLVDRDTMLRLITNAKRSIRREQASS